MLNLAANRMLIESLGWTLLHSLWQLAAVALILAVAFWAMRQRSPQARYLLGLVGLAAMLALPIGTFVYLHQGPPPLPAPVMLATPPMDHSDLLPASANPSTTFITPPTAASTPLAEQLKHAAEPLLPYAVWLYLTGLLLFSCRLLTGYARLWQLRRQTTETPRELRQRLTHLMRQMHITRPIALVHSALVEVPTVLGALRPIILLPIAAATGLSPEQLAALLAHELAHIRRHDYLINQIQTLIETFLFYHPALWWLSARIRQEREHCCDDLAARAVGDTVVYAEALTRMEMLRPVRGSAGARLALGADGGVLLARIRRLLGVPAPRGDRRRWNVVTAASALVALGVMSSLLYVAGCSQNERAEKAVVKPVEKDDQIVTTYDITNLVNILDRSDVTPPVNAEEYITSLMHAMDTESWQDWGGKGTITASNGQLIVSQTPATHVKIAAKLVEMSAQNRQDLLEDMKLWATEPKIAVFDIRDLLFFANQTPATTAPATQPAATTQDAARRAQLVADLMTTIEFTVDPDSWDTVPGGLGSLREHSGQLIVRHTAPHILRVWKLLQEIRSKRASQIVIACRVLLVEEATLKTLESFGEIKDKENLNMVLTDDQAKKFFTAAARSTTNISIPMPRITLFNGGNNSFSLLHLQNYISGYEWKGPDPKDLEITPKISTLQTGLIFNVEAAVSPDQRYVFGKLRPRFNRLDAMKTAPAPNIPPEMKLFIQLPVVTELSPFGMVTPVAIPRGSVAVIGGTKVTGDVQTAMRETGTMSPVTTMAALATEAPQAATKSPAVVRYLLYFVQPTVLESFPK